MILENALENPLLPRVKISIMVKMDNSRFLNYGENLEKLLINCVLFLATYYEEIEK